MMTYWEIWLLIISGAVVFGLVLFVTYFLGNYFFDLREKRKR